MEKVEPTSNERMDSRVGVRATLAGIIVTLSCMYFLMSFAAVLGFWSFQFEELPSLGVPFWSLTSAAWIFSVCLGALVSVLVSKTHQVLTGALQALVVWGASYLIFGGLTVTIAESSFYDMIFPTSEVLLRIGFFGDAIALAGAVASGWFAVQIQKGVERKVQNKEVRDYAAPERTFQMPAHT